MIDSNFQNITKLNLELTSKCALSCPRCDRTESKGLYPQQELSLDFIKNRIPTKMLGPHFTFDLSGNYGDPVYHSKLIDIIKYLKSFNVKIYIETNGSGRNKDWWIELVSYLDKKDIIAFSIDGLSDTNHIYRVNSKWSEILDAVSISAPHVSTHWKFIIFKHNQHQIEQARELAKKIGVKTFKTVKSSLFYFGYGEENDKFMPDKEHLSESLISRIKRRTEKSTQVKSIIPVTKKMFPKCVSVERHYISSEGHYFPCCWIALKSQQKDNFLAHRLDELSLHNNTLEEILQSQIIKDLFRSWHDITTAPMTCRSKCQENVKTNTSHQFNYQKVN
jgi:MoaA/NifB/PqqE/SkfB family radical SAM enzyme